MRLAHEIRLKLRYTSALAGLLALHEEKKVPWIADV
jgi:hypothetical protein